MESLLVVSKPPVTQTGGDGVSIYALNKLTANVSNRVGAGRAPSQTRMIARKAATFSGAKLCSLPAMFGRLHPANNALKAVNHQIRLAL